MDTSDFEGVVCFGGEDWWYHNRGHIDMQVMRRLARLGPALYINSIVMQKPKVSEGRKFLEKLVRKSRSIFRGCRPSGAGFWVYSPFFLPVHHISWARPLNEMLLKSQLWRIGHKLGIRKPIVWVACPVACDVAIGMKREKLVYQRTDRFEDFPGVDKDAIRRFDLRLKEMADLTVFVNEQLLEEESSQCRRAIYLDHGVDYELFASAEKASSQPPEVRDIPRPIIGFYGGFAEHTTDIALLEKVVAMMADKSFVFVGQPNSQCASLASKKNVWMLGRKPYEQIAGYGKCFDVAIMPWRQNRWIEACNPIKLKEYLALGKPIVSTPFPELQKYGDLVYQATTPDGFAQAIERALLEDNIARIAARRAAVAQSTWDHKVTVLLDSLFPNHGNGKVHVIPEGAQ